MTMPLWHTRSGPDITQSDGTIRTPMAIKATCEGCGAENAANGDVVNGKVVRWCGYSSERGPHCKAESKQLFE